MFVIIQFHCKYRIPKGQSKMDNPEKLATQFNTMLVITRRRKTGQKHNIMCVRYHYNSVSLFISKYFVFNYDKPRFIVIYTSAIHIYYL